ncbi:TPA: hypothetical protein OUD52_004094 [Escherichia coli]|uniref:hypothetical protein n=1 Tax=Enterobacteriaceae TaxID=543 RepID=UPI00211594DE|nr:MULTISPECIES: hypothetical protein [Enterobacteriaceae]ELT9297460.1 hypothetical protein [Enterobacter kobei]MCW4844859.1 hypothetical protein [Enterobacter hormaechei subsp. xiangfangensis]UUD48930.1 hypothetical protein KKZ10_22760 [Escherichia coli]UUD58151.1 hypothetical protein KKZ13_24165 [Escherichia coli]HBN0055436.1 hypothetical protein [Escherichia coli]
MKWSFQKVTAMIVGLAIFLLGGWIMNLVKLVNGGDLQFDAESIFGTVKTNCLAN